MSDTTSWQERFSLIGAVQPKLHRVSYNIETIPNAPKHYETNKKKEFIVQWTGPGAFVLKLSDTTSWHVLFFSNGTSSTQIASSFVQQRNDPRCSQALRNSPKHEFRVQCSGPSAIVAKMSDTTLWHELFSLITSVQPKLHRVLLSNETVPDAPKHYKTNKNMNLGSNGVDQVRSL